MIPRKISTFDTRFLIFFIFALSLYHYGIKFYLDDLHYVLRTPYVWTIESLSHITHFLLPNKELSAMKSENAALRKQICLSHNLKAHVPAQHVPVLQYFDTGCSRTILIPNHKFQVGDVVVAQGYLVGRILSVGKNVATVQLVTDQASSVPIYFENYNGIATGESATRVRISRLDKRPQNCHPGSVVYTSGIDGLYPKNLLVGRIQRIGIDQAVVRCDLDFKIVGAVEVMRYK